MTAKVFYTLTLILGLSFSRNEKDEKFKHEIAEAITTVTDDVQKQKILIRIAWLESNFRVRVANCRITGDKGKSLGIYQIQPITKSDARKACGTILEQTQLALKYVSRSFNACSKNTGYDLLAMYVSGTCKKGIRQAKNRWSDASQIW